MQWYVAVIKKYTVFEGRAHRTEFWMFALVNFIIGAVLAILDAALGTSSVLGGIYSLAVLLPSLAVGVRRLHDTGRSGWWLLLGLIPLIGLIVLIVWWATEGERSTNQYGPNPWDGPQPV